MQRHLRLQLIRAVTSSPPSTPPPLSLIELLTKEMIQIKKNEINNEYENGLTFPPPSPAAASATVYSATASSAAMAFPPPPPPLLYSPPALPHNMLTKERINRTVSRSSHEHT